MTERLTPTARAFLANQRKQQAVDDILDAIPWMVRDDLTPTQWDEAIKTYWAEMEQQGMGDKFTWDLDEDVEFLEEEDENQQDD